MRTFEIIFTDGSKVRVKSLPPVLSLRKHGCIKFEDHRITWDYPLSIIGAINEVC